MSFNSNNDDQHCGFGIIEPTALYCSPINEQQCMEQQSFQYAATSGKVFHSHGVDFVRQPCKARAIEIKRGQNPHVARFAYIDIPIGTKHGTVLSCCHPVCIDSGRRFRYCIICRTAVAKRNFNVRHAHGSLNSPPPRVDGGNSSSVKNNNGQDIVATTVPSTISTDESNGSKDSMGSDSIMVSLSPKEAEIINFFRSRPGDDYVTTLDQWKDSLMRMAEELTCRRSELQTPIVNSESIHATNMANITPDDDNDAASMTSFLDKEDFESFDSFVTTPNNMNAESSHTTDKPTTTPDDDGASMTSFLDKEEFENFDNFVTDFFQDV